VYNHDVCFEDALIGAVAINGSPLPEQTLNLCITDAVLFELSVKSMTMIQKQKCDRSKDC
jgi:hypothetical protein